MKVTNLKHETGERLSAKYKSDRKKTKREASYTIKRERRIAPFQELSARNKSLVERSKSIVSLANNTPFWENPKYDEAKILGLPNLSSSICIVMSKGNPREPYSGMVAWLTVAAHSPFEHRNGHESTYPKRQSATVELYAASAQVIDSVTERPSYSPIEKRERIEGAGTPYAAFCEDNDGCCDAIMSQANDSMVRRDEFYTPVRALGNFLERRSIDKRLNEFEKRLGWVEQAIMDPELNPVLVSRISPAQEESVPLAT